VAVTGATGFIASELIHQLLAKGYTVRGTVRNLADKSKYAYLQQMGGKFIPYEADLLVEGSFDKAFDGCSIVFHTASPFRVKVEDPQRDLIDPALKGTKNVLSSVVRSRTIKSVIVTSSVAAVVPQVHDMNPDKVWSEEDWNTNSSPTAGPYRYSKTLAERAFWDWAKEHPNVHTAVINPGFVLGPVHSARADGESIELMTSYLNGSAQEAGIANNNCFPIVDVRDVALAHITAAEKQTASGRFLLVSNEAVPYPKVVEALKVEFPHYPLPSKINGALSYIAKFNRTKAENDLGIVFTPLQKTVTDMANSLIKHGVVPPVAKV